MSSTFVNNNHNNTSQTSTNNNTLHNNTRYLIDASITVSTNNKYKQAYKNFKHYLRTHHHKRMKHLSQQQLDQYLVQYLHYLYEQQIPISIGFYTLSCIPRYTTFTPH